MTIPHNIRYPQLGQEVDKHRVQPPTVKVHAGYSPLEYGCAGSLLYGGALLLMVSTSSLSASASESQTNLKRSDKH